MNSLKETLIKFSDTIEKSIKKINRYLDTELEHDVFTNEFIKISSKTEDLIVEIIKLFLTNKQITLLNGSKKYSPFNLDILTAENISIAIDNFCVTFHKGNKVKKMESFLQFINFKNELICEEFFVRFNELYKIRNCFSHPEKINNPLSKGQWQIKTTEDLIKYLKSSNKNGQGKNFEKHFNDILILIKSKILKSTI